MPRLIAFRTGAAWLKALEVLQSAQDDDEWIPAARALLVLSASDRTLWGLISNGRLNLPATVVDAVNESRTFMQFPLEGNWHDESLVEHRRSGIERIAAELGPTLERAWKLAFRELNAAEFMKWWAAEILADEEEVT